MTATIEIYGKVWTTDWPTEPGWYWFWGWKYGDRTEQPPRLHTVEVKRGRTIEGGSALIYLIDGNFMYKVEGHTGFFAPMDIPNNLPDWTWMKDELKQ